MNARAKTLTPRQERMDEIVSESQALMLTKRQLFVAWGAIAIMLFGVYLFGFYSGREEGVELALSEQATPRLRLPVDDSKSRALLAKPEVIEPIAQEKTKFDFTNTAVDSEVPARQDPIAPKAEKADPASGFVSRAASEIVRDQETLGKPDAGEPLSDRVAKVELSNSLAASRVESSSGAGTGDTVKISPPIQKETVKTQLVEPVKREEKAIAKAVAPTKVAAEKPVTPPTPKEIKKITPPSGGFFVQVAAPDSMIKAQSVVARLKSKGITAAVRDASVNNQVHYRVLVGPFSSRDSAQEAKVKIVRSGAVQGEPFIKNY